MLVDSCLITLCREAQLYHKVGDYWSLYTLCAYYLTCTLLVNEEYLTGGGQCMPLSSLDIDHNLIGAGIKRDVTSDLSNRLGVATP